MLSPSPSAVPLVLTQCATHTRGRAFITREHQNQPKRNPQSRLPALGTHNNNLRKVCCGWWSIYCRRQCATHTRARQRELMVVPPLLHQARQVRSRRKAPVRASIPQIGLAPRDHLSLLYFQAHTRYTSSRKTRLLQGRQAPPPASLPRRHPADAARAPPQMTTFAPVAPK